jgi:hypothetical protein
MKITMRYIYIDEIVVPLAKHILMLGKKEGCGLYDAATKDLSKAHQVNSFHLPFPLRFADDFDLAYRKLEEGKYIKTVFHGYVPIFENGEPTDYESDYSNFYFIITDIHGLKEYEDKLEKIYPKREAPLIKLKALKLIAKKIGEFNTGESLKNFLEEQGVNSKLIFYPNTKWRMVYDVFEYLAFSNKNEDGELLFKLIEEISHPLVYGGDKNRALEIQDYFTNCLEYDGYCIYKGKLIKASDEILAEVEKRVLERGTAKRPTLLYSEAGSTNKTSVNTGTERTRIDVIINNTQVQAPNTQQLTQGMQKKFPFKLPAGTKWEDLTIKFLDAENIFIQVKQFKHRASFYELGMIGKGKTPSPSEAWIFFKTLAQLNGELSIKDAQAKDKYKKQKEILAKSLQDYFSIDYDPFFPYHSSSEKTGNSYKIKITLIPPLHDSHIINKEPNEADDEKFEDLGINEYFNEQTPIINKDDNYRDE